MRLTRSAARASAAALAAASLVATTWLGAGPTPATASTAGNVTTATDYCQGQCHDILPPGSAGNATLTQILAFKLTGIEPTHAEDQLAKYGSLVDGYPSLSGSTLSTYFNDFGFNVPDADVESTTRPGGRGDVTIVTDKQTGTPHIYGTTRAGTEFGAGYAAAQGRLWLMDVFRHLGRGQLSSFAGGAPGNRALEQSFYQGGAYTESDRQAQLDRLAASGSVGAQVVHDIGDYVSGVNQYITDVKLHENCPGEYALTGNTGLTCDGIQPFKATDMVAIGTVISSLFGSSSGSQVQAALVKLAAERKYGVPAGERMWNAFREENDPEAVLTVHDGQSFPYATSPAHPAGVAMPDWGSVRAEPVAYSTESSATAPSTALTPSTTSTTTMSRTAANTVSVLSAMPSARRLSGMANAGVLPRNLFTARHGMSNALVVSAKYAEGGHPLAVMGPQAGYLAPQLLMAEDLHGPGLDAQGVSFAGLSMYVELGRGADYSWSATSAGQDIVDTFALPLCDPAGGTATIDSDGYLDDGTCQPMEHIVTTNSWSPSIADQTPAGSYRLVALKTKFGIVKDRATIGGKPVAYTALRSTYGHEVDTLKGFELLNDPAAVTSPADFQTAVSNIGYTFHWFYVDAQNTAYANSGLDPVRAPNVDPNLPVWGTPTYQWRGWDPATNTVAGIPYSAHPQSVNQDYYVSWNNKAAKDFAMADWGDGSVFRVNLLDSRVKALIASGTKVTEADLTRAMADASVTDLRGEDVLPLLLNVIGDGPIADQATASAVAQLRTWMQAGAKRRETSAGSKTYADTDAIRVMDAWWPLLVQAEFEPGMGSDLYTELTHALQVDEAPSGAHSGLAHQGSAFEYGWWSYVDKDLRTVLGRPVSGGLGRTFCGGGNLVGCRTVLLSTLQKAVGTPATTVYPGDSTCKAGDQWCADSIVQNALGGLSHPNISWQNRPTFQQVVQYPAHR